MAYYTNFNFPNILDFSLFGPLYFSFYVFEHTENYPCSQQSPIEIYLYFAINNQVPH